MKHIKAGGGDVVGSIVVGSLAAMGGGHGLSHHPALPSSFQPEAPSSNAPTSECNYKLIRNYQGCMEASFFPGFDSPYFGLPTPPRCRVKLPPREALNYNVCVGRESAVRPYTYYHKDAKYFEAFYLTNFLPPDDIPTMSDAERRAVEHYESGLDDYRKLATQDTDLWTDELRTERCHANYGADLEALEKTKRQLESDTTSLKLVLDNARLRLGELQAASELDRDRSRLQPGAERESAVRELTRKLKVSVVPEADEDVAILEKTLTDEKNQLQALQMKLQIVDLLKQLEQDKALYEQERESGRPLKLQQKRAHSIKQLDQHIKELRSQLKALVYEIKHGTLVDLD